MAVKISSGSTEPLSFIKYPPTAVSSTYTDTLLVAAENVIFPGCLTTTFVVTSVVSVLLFNALDHPSLQIDHHLGKNNQGVSKVNSEGVVQLLWLIVIAFSLLYAMGQTNQFIYFQF